MVRLLLHISVTKGLISSRLSPLLVVVVVIVGLVAVVPALLPSLVMGSITMRFLTFSNFFLFTLFLFTGLKELG